MRIFQKTITLKNIKNMKNLTNNISKLFSLGSLMVFLVISSCSDDNEELNSGTQPVREKPSIPLEFSVPLSSRRSARSVELGFGFCLNTGNYTVIIFYCTQVTVNFAKTTMCTLGAK